METVMEADKFLFLPLNGALRERADGNWGFPEVGNQRVTLRAKEVIARHHEMGYRIALVDNQGGIPKYKGLNTALQEMMELLWFLPEVSDLLFCTDYNGPKRDELLGCFGYWLWIPEGGGMPQLTRVRSVGVMPASMERLTDRAPGDMENPSKWLRVNDLGGFRQPEGGLLKLLLKGARYGQLNLLSQSPDDWKLIAENSVGIWGRDENLKAYHNANIGTVFSMEEWPNYVKILA